MIKRLLCLLTIIVSLSSAQPVRVMSYNLENYPSTRNGISITEYEPYYKAIINSINPDVFVGIEVVQQAGVNQFLSNVLSNDYKAVNVTISGTNSSGNDGNDCAFYYRSSLFTLIGYNPIPAKTRVISKFTLVHNFSKDTLIVFGVHLKANDYTSDNVLNAQKRDSTVTTLRAVTKKYPSKTNYLVCGDFNIFSSNETAFQKLIDKSSPGYFIDPLNVFGDWNANADFNTACSYSSGKLQTRLDMILISQSLKELGGVDYRDGSFKIFGNDGNHFGKAVNNGTNLWFQENPVIGTALVNASDHLPVYADFSFGVPVTSVSKDENVPADMELKQNYPNPFNPETVISYRLSAPNHVSLKVYDLLGREITTLVNELKPAGFYNSQFSIVNSQLPSGTYFYQLKVGNFVQTKKMVYLQ